MNFKIGSPNKIARINESFRISSTPSAPPLGDANIWVCGSNENGQLNMLTDQPYLDTLTKLNRRFLNLHTDGKIMLGVSGNNFAVYRHFALHDSDFVPVPSTSDYLCVFYFECTRAGPYAGIGIKQSDYDHLYIFDLFTGEIYAQLLVSLVDKNNEPISEPLKNFSYAKLGPATILNDQFTYSQETVRLSPTSDGVSRSDLLINNNLCRIYQTQDNEFHFVQVRNLTLISDPESVIDITQSVLAMSNNSSGNPGGYFVIQGSETVRNKIVTKGSSALESGSPYDTIPLALEIKPDPYFLDIMDLSAPFTITAFYANNSHIICDAYATFTQTIPGVVNQGTQKFRWIYSANRDKLYLLLAVNIYGCIYAPTFDQFLNPNFETASGLILYPMSGSITTTYEDTNPISLSGGIQNSQLHGVGKIFDPETDKYYIAGWGTNHRGQIGTGVSIDTIYCEPNTPLAEIDQNPTFYEWPYARGNITLVYGYEA